jgi:hypothetical protein
MKSRYLVEVVDHPQRSGEREGRRQGRRENRAHHLARHSWRQAPGVGDAPLLSDLHFGIVGSGCRPGWRE